MQLIKLTDSRGYTRRRRPGETRWEPGVWPPRLAGTALCEAGVYHAYVSPEQAVLMDPAHACLLPDGLAWWAEGDVVVNDGTKCGCHSLMLLEPAELPELSLAARVRAAIYCAQAVLPADVCLAWHPWAAAWLDGSDRSARGAARGAAWADAARGAADAARAARGAARGAAWAAAWTARRAAWAADIDIAEIVRRALADEEVE